MTIETYIISGTFAIISIIISTLIAPHIMWNIEKKRIKQNRRILLIKNSKRIISKVEFDYIRFLSTPEYSNLKSYLSNELILNLKSRGRLKVIQDFKEYIKLNNKKFRTELLDELNKLEKKWNLI